MRETSAAPNGERLGIVLVFAGLAVACVLFASVGFVLAFFTDACGVASTTCDAGLVAVGTAVAGVIPWLLTVAGTISVALRLRHGQPIGRVPWVSLIGALLVAVIGVVLVFMGGGFEFAAPGNEPAAPVD